MVEPRAPSPPVQADVKRFVITASQGRKAHVHPRTKITEPHRVSRRLQLLTGWSHDEEPPDSPEVRERAVRMIFDYRGEYASQDETIVAT